MAELRLIVGLGNPGAEHANTRHNAGFRLVDALAEKAGARFGLESKLFGETARVDIGGRSVWPMKGWTSAARIKNDKEETWDAAALGARIKEELAKGITKGENLAAIFTGGL